MAKDQLTIAGPRHAAGVLRLPGSKSISNRALLMAALGAPAHLSNVLMSDDTQRMLDALSLLGVRATIEDNNVNLVQGLSHQTDAKENKLHTLDLGNAGTAMRPLTAILAARPGQYLLTGDKRMCERPIGPLVEALRQLGADIEYKGQIGFPPLLIHGKALTGGYCELDATMSSQYITALLMMLPCLAGDSTLTLKGELVSWPYVEITLKMMADFGISDVLVRGRTIHTRGGQSYQCAESYQVESDASSASYFISGAAITNSSLVLEGVGKNSVQGDIQFVDVMREMGAQIEIEKGSIRVLGAPNGLVGLDCDLNHIPDAAMTIATVAIFAEGPTTIRNIENWRIKETDRLAAMATELSKVGAQVEEGRDFLTIYPPKIHTHAMIETYDDHRMAMCFSLLGLKGPGITILDPQCCSKTYPGFFEDFERVFVKDMSAS
ncbi:MULTISPECIES: 3-phosphoshikimate 1-carboxyvinyltransferase [Gammaproteobacteria]|uniref:3-phosphoshikimate 1-carboxyvinyltransferase n=1 Tax=Gammaproteobacteria TaxID=1236 RepID=UPI000DD04C64|nr:MULTISPECIES: 3-phosphoshikimate 1-carboxyvinyltransferase [Gammaproteobacteria]RTE87296.1 3-phosphoshikimate 1-carboxyvinyltransferase [Aliidiomarina sp. B3213]TCZ92919.1 3-phosphoshikimate 1-carboxyvinyltransferase [Lysobacter sp. N42]